MSNLRCLSFLVTLAPSTEAAGYVHQYFNEGYLFVHDQVRKAKTKIFINL